MTAIRNRSFRLSPEKPWRGTEPPHPSAVPLCTPPGRARLGFPALSHRARRGLRGADRRRPGEPQTRRGARLAGSGSFAICRAATGCSSTGSACLRPDRPGDRHQAGDGRSGLRIDAAVPAATADERHTEGGSAGRTPLDADAQRYFSDDSDEPAGERTMMIRRAFQNIQRQQRRRHRVTIAASGWWRWPSRRMPCTSSR